MNYSFKSADNISTVHAVKWIPEKEPIAILQIVHGMMEYIERYDEFARFLNEQGFIVAGHDHIGHGHTAENNSELGIMKTNDPSGVMVEDIYTNYTKLKAEYPDLPYFILGHSMGSYMLRKFLSVKSNKLEGLSGAIIMGTGTESDLLLYPGRVIVNIVGRIKSWDYKSNYIKGLMFGPAYKGYNLDGSDPENSWLTTDSSLVKKYYDHEHCVFDFSVNGYRALVDATIFDNRIKNIKKIRKDLPILFISGDKDPVGNLGKGVKAAYRKFKIAGIKNVTLKLYEGMRHEVLNEVDRIKVYKYIYLWLKTQM